MDRTKPSCSDLDFSDVQHRVYAKYDVTQSDARLAVEYVHCFFDAKRARPNDLIILPQIADWAWHELVLDTARYRTVCSLMFGKFLHHVATTVPNTGSKAHGLRELDRARALSRDRLEPISLRETFLKSLAVMRGGFGFGLGQGPDPWVRGGWGRA